MYLLTDTLDTKRSLTLFPFIYLLFTLNQEHRAHALENELRWELEEAQQSIAAETAAKQNWEATANAGAARNNALQAAKDLAVKRATEQRAVLVQQFKQLREVGR